MSKVVIKTTDPESGAVHVIAKGILGEDVLEADGNIYFMPDAVNKDVLKKTEDTYTCPYKGLCYYYDIINPDTGDSIRTHASWVYDTPMDGWEMIAGKYGFYPYDMNGVMVEMDEEEGSAREDQEDVDLAAVSNQ